MTAVPFKHVLAERFVRPAEFMGMIVLDLAKMGLPVEAAFEPSAFGRVQSRINDGSILRIHGTNGRCWATVTGVAADGTLIIEPDVVPAIATTTDAVPTRQRRAA